MTTRPDRRLPTLAKLGHVHLATPDLEASLWFFRDVIGLDEVARADGCVYLRAWGEFDHHSLVLSEGEPTVDHIGWRAAHPDVLDELRLELEREGVPVLDVPAGTELGQGRAIRFVTPVGGQPFEVYWDMERPAAPPELRTKMRGNASRRSGAGSRRGGSTTSTSAPHRPPPPRRGSATTSASPQGSRSS